MTQNHLWAQATAKDDGGFCFYAVFQVGVHGTPSAKIFPKEVGLGALLSGAVEHPAAMNDTTPQMFPTPLLPPPHGLRSGADEAWEAFF